MKICTHCLKHKINSDFYKRKEVSNGLQSWCKDCIKACYGNVKNRNKNFMNKKCRYCSQKLVLNKNWRLSRAKSYLFICNDCEYERVKEYYWEKVQQVMAFYTNQKMCCDLCGYDNIDCLSIDHIDSDGAVRRKIKSNIDNAQQLVKRNFPSGFRILCRNCQWIAYGEYKENRKYKVKKDEKIIAKDI